MCRWWFLRWWNNIFWQRPRTLVGVFVKKGLRCLQSQISNRWTLSIWTDVLFQWMTLLMKFLKPRFCRWSWCQTASLFKVAATRGDPNRYRQLRATRLGMPWILGFGGQDHKYSFYRSIYFGKNRFKNFEECCIPLGVSRPNFFATGYAYLDMQACESPTRNRMDWSITLKWCVAKLFHVDERCCHQNLLYRNLYLEMFHSTNSLYAAYGTSFGSVCYMFMQDDV